MAALLKSEVFEACADIYAETGKPPTQQQVRERLGKGSFSTLGPWRKEWCEHFLVDAAVADVLPQQVNKAIALLYQSMQTEVSQDISQMRANYEAQVEDVRNQLEREQAARQALEEQVGQLKVDNRELKVDIAVRDTQIDDARKDLADSLQRHRDLQKTLRQLQMDLDKEAKALRTARENETQLNRDVAHLSKSLGETEGRLSSMQSELDRSESKRNKSEEHHLKVESEWKQKTQDLTREVIRLQTIADRVPDLEASANLAVELQAEVGRLRSLETDNQKLVSEIAGIQATANRVPVLEQDLRNQVTANGGLQEKIKELRRQAAALQDQLAEAATSTAHSRGLEPK